MRLSIVLMGLAMAPAFAGPLAGDVAATQGPAVRVDVRWTPVRRAVQVQRLAHQMENRSRRLVRRADDRRHHYTRGEDRAVRALYVLSRESARFHDQVERFRRNRRRTLANFRDLERAFVRAARVVNRGHVDGRVRRDFERVARTFDELAYYMGRRAYPRAGARGVVYFKDVPARGAYDGRFYDYRRYQGEFYGYESDRGHGYESDRGWDDRDDRGYGDDDRRDDRGGYLDRDGGYDRGDRSTVDRRRARPRVRS